MQKAVSVSTGLSISGADCLRRFSFECLEYCITRSVLGGGVVTGEMLLAEKIPNLEMSNGEEGEVLSPVEVKGHQGMSGVL